MVSGYTGLHVHITAFNLSGACDKRVVSRSTSITVMHGNYKGLRFESWSVRCVWDGCRCVLVLCDHIKALYAISYNMRSKPADKAAGLWPVLHGLTVTFIGKPLISSCFCRMTAEISCQWAVLQTGTHGPEMYNTKMVNNFVIKWQISDLQIRLRHN